MKYLLVIIVVWVGYMVWRAQRRKDAGSQQPGTTAGKGGPADPIAQDMVKCPVCALHLPRTDALVGERGLYCSDEHRRAAEH